MRSSIVLVALLLSAAGCNHGFEPPDEPPVGSIRVFIEYVTAPADWPPSDSLRDLRFVAMRFFPQDTTDFFQLNRMAISPGLKRRVRRDTVQLDEVETGTFFYSGVAQQFSSNLIDWRPIGLYEENDGIFEVRGGETVELNVTADFRHPPPFPPPSVN